MDEESWQVVGTAQGVIKARILEGRLEAEGIPVRLQYEPIGAIYAITVDGLGEVQVLVPEMWVQHARRVLAKEYSEEDLEWQDETPPIKKEDSTR
jgi:hypothetical protein